MKRTRNLFAKKQPKIKKCLTYLIIPLVQEMGSITLKNLLQN